MVIGAGLGGLRVALAMQQQASVVNVVLIDAKEYFELPLAIINVVTQPTDELVEARERAITRDLRTLLPQGKVVTGYVTNVDPKARTVTVADGTTVDFDYLVLASGSTIAQPFKFNAAVSTPADSTLEGRIAYLKSERQRLYAAKNILVIGGGFTGVEAAAEYAVRIPTAHVTLVHNYLDLCSALPAKARNAIKKFFNKLPNVTLLLNQRVDQKPGCENVYLQKNGTELHMDVVHMAKGLKPNTGFLTASMPTALNKDKFVRVRPTMQVRA